MALHSVGEGKRVDQTLSIFPSCKTIIYIPTYAREYRIGAEGNGGWEKPAGVCGIGAIERQGYCQVLVLELGAW